MLEHGLRDDAKEEKGEAEEHPSQNSSLLSP
jgi:hypothetical protein